MKSRYFSFAMGMLTGAVLFGGTVAYAAGVLAEHAPQTAYVDGAAVQLEAYNIDGYNYVKLRDIGQAVGFNVYWDGQSIQMDSDAPYTGETPAQPAGSFRVNSINGNTLKVGDRSSLITSPYGLECSAVSSNPEILSLEKVMGCWVAVSRAPGTAAVTLTTQDGRTGSTSFTVLPNPESAVDLNANMEIRLEMIRLINEVRRENGVAELPVNDALMNAAQDISTRRYTTHHTQEECETAMAYGYPHGFGNNLTVFSVTDPQYVAKQAVENWISSPGHFQAMIDPMCDSIGVGVTISGGRAYCHMFAGDSNSHHPYE